MSLTDREKERLLAVAEATVGEGGSLYCRRPSPNAIVWWSFPTTTINYSQNHDTLEAALAEAAERLGVLP